MSPALLVGLFVFSCSILLSLNPISVMAETEILQAKRDAVQMIGSNLKFHVRYTLVGIVNSTHLSDSIEQQDWRIALSDGQVELSPTKGLNGTQVLHFSLNTNDTVTFTKNDKLNFRSYASIEPRSILVSNSSLENFTWTSLYAQQISFKIDLRKSAVSKEAFVTVPVKLTFHFSGRVSGIIVDEDSPLAESLQKKISASEPSTHETRSVTSTLKSAILIKGESVIVTGTVRDSNSNPVSNVPVLVSVGSSKITSTSNATGGYFASIPTGAVGTFPVSVSIPYANVSAPELSVTVFPLPGPPPPSTEIVQSGIATFLAILTAWAGIELYLYSRHHFRKKRNSRI